MWEHLKGRLQSNESTGEKGECGLGTNYTTIHPHETKKARFRLIQSGISSQY